MNYKYKNIRIQLIMAYIDNLDGQMEIYNNFDDMNLQETLLRGIYRHGFEKPSEIQKRGIVLISKGGDVIVQSQSGTGKTGTFIIGILNIIDYALKEGQAIVLVPTRELAIQVVDVCKSIGSLTSVKPILCVGGSHVEENKRDLQANYPKIVIGTPGRVLDMIDKKCINPKFIKTFVIDEADEMLSTGFINTIQDIVRMMPSSTQMCLFSATLPDEIKNLANEFMVNPTTIYIKPEEISLDGIRQFYIQANDEYQKFEIFKELFGILTVNQTIVYINTKRGADMLRDKLQKENYSVSVIHSQMTPQERSYVMNEFKQGKSKVLISTDLLARGIDIQQVSVVINYELPHNVENYIHRIGRSGRFGRKGTAINIVLNREYYKLGEITKYYGGVIYPFPENYSDF